MRVTEQVAVAGAGLLGATGVGLAAYAAHASALDGRHAAILQRGVEMQIWHALALLGAARIAGRCAAVAVWGLLAGTLLFCAGVDTFAFGEAAIVGMAPVGGTLLILSWLVLGAAAFRRNT